MNRLQLVPGEWYMSLNFPSHFFKFLENRSDYMAYSERIFSDKYKIGEDYISNPDFFKDIEKADSCYLQKHGVLLTYEIY